jgi:hypothetical protein
MDKAERHRKWYQANKARLRKTKSETMRRLRAERPEHYREQSRLAKQRLRDKLFAAYGSTCLGCGFTDKRALTLDHILNNGSKERKAIGERGVYRRALDPKHKAEYQMLCMNCQFIKRVEAQRQYTNG